MKETFTTRYGVEKEGQLVRQYSAYEGGMRYIFRTTDGEYRCIKKDGKFVEYVA